MQYSAHVYKKNFNKEGLVEDFIRNIVYVFRSLVSVAGIFFLSVFGVLLFLLEFGIVKGTLIFIVTRLGVYLLAQYVTILPTYLVVLFVLLPTKFSFPMTAVISFVSLFVLFAV